MQQKKSYDCGTVGATLPVHQLSFGSQMQVQGEKTVEKLLHKNSTFKMTSPCSHGEWASPKCFPGSRGLT